MQRRDFLKLSAGTAAAAAFASRVSAQGALKEIRIGYQKTGVLVITRQRAALEKHFAPQGIAVKWVEFSSGPPMMEAMNVGSVDYGAVGDSPPVFAQAAGAAIVYAAGQPITNGQGILVPKDSPIRSLADLKGKRIGFTKGSSAHNVVVQTLEEAGLTYADIVPVYLTPPDAGPAFANGSIEAWAIWDPYFAIGETRQNGRILVNAREITKTNSFYLANRDFASCVVADAPQSTIPDNVRTLLYDPQTAGGLLISVAADHGAALLDALCQKGLPAAKIGRVLAARSDADGGPAIILR